MEEAQRAAYPTTIQEMLEQGWYEKIFKKVSKYTLNDILNTPEELTQDIILQIQQSKYLERFNPELRSFEVYIYTLVMNCIKKRGMREGSKGGRCIVNHYSLEISQDDNDEQNSGKAYLDRLDQFVLDDPYSDIIMQDLIDSTRFRLQEIKANSSVIYNGVEVSRDPLTVFNLIVEGKSIPEIAEIFQTSKQFIYILLAKIRDTPEMQEFHADFEHIHGISSRGKRHKKTLSTATF